jgi:hypothetical protein
MMHLIFMRLNTCFMYALLLCLLPGISIASVSPEEAKSLSNNLTFIGATKAGSDNGIPEWKGSIEPPKGYRSGEKLIDPFSVEKPLFVITADNMDQYKDQLTPGQQAMLKKYKNYKMPIYKTHRVAGYPEELRQKTLQNATQVKLISTGNGLIDYVEGIPFPIPQNGLEAIWNHIVRYRGGSAMRSIVQVTPQANGDYVPVKFEEEFTFKTHLEDFDPKTMQDSNILFYFKQQVLAPARLAGNVLLLHETLNQVKDPRKAWIYNAGQRRVRLAPQVAYDGPGTASDGLRTSDNFDMYNGAPDRYEWRLLGKKELFIPYNAYRFASGDLKYSDIVKAGHLNQDYARYERHRVWMVEATLKKEARHVYAKRLFYLDEDTWQAAVIDHYDARNELWRVAEAHALFFYQEKVPWYAFEVLYDLQSGRYLALGLNNEERGSYQFGFKRKERDYTPQALRRSGRR